MKMLKKFSAVKYIIPKIFVPGLNNKKGQLDISRLTKREKQILDFLVAGKVTKEIASEINLAERTVKFHLSSLYNKVGVSGVRELLALV